VFCKDGRHERDALRWRIRTESPITWDLDRTVKQVPTGSSMKGVPKLLQVSMRQKRGKRQAVSVFVK
jgi:hypothetical protein